MQIANARRLTARGPFSIIPILREGDYTSTYLSDHRYLDFRTDAKYDESLTDLVRWLNGEVAKPSLGVDLGDPKAITEALPFLRHCQVSGYAIGNPPNGGVGKIRLWDGDLSYTRQSHDGWWGESWHKDHFGWKLEWDDELGVIATERSAESDK